jgi:2-octaprenyl-6-methoxyphenol hydroxylase
VARPRHDAGGVTVEIAAGPTIRARLLVVAEGRASPTRTAAGIGTFGFAYRQHALVAAIAHERPHRGIALEHFLPGGPFAQLPLPGDRSGIVLTDRPEVVGCLAALPDAGLSRELARRLGADHLGTVQVVGRRWTYPLSAMLADRYVAPRLALVGDAAHGIHPIAGQGLNLGFRDVAALADLVVAAARDGRDPGDPGLLRAYQAARRPANLAMLMATDGLDRLFSSANPALTLARRAGIAATDRMDGAKRVFMRAATGLLDRAAA